MLALASITNDITFSLEWLLRVCHNHILSVAGAPACVVFIKAQQGPLHLSTMSREPALDLLVIFCYAQFNFRSTVR